MGDRLGDRQGVLADAQRPDPLEQPGQDALPDEHVDESDRQGPPGDQAEGEEDGGVDRRADCRPDGGADRPGQPGAARLEDGPGDERSRGDQGDREPDGHDQLGDHDPPTVDRLGQEEDGGPVLQLGAEGGGAEDEPDDRQQGRDDQPVHDRGRHLLASDAGPAGQLDEDGHGHGQQGQEGQEHAPSATEEAARGQGGDRDDDRAVTGRDRGPAGRTERRRTVHA